MHLIKTKVFSFLVIVLFIEASVFPSMSGTINDENSRRKFCTNIDTQKGGWNTTFGGSNIDVGHSVHQTSDGGFIITGNSKSIDGDVSENQGENDIWVLKTDSDGNLIWQGSFGGSNLDYGFDAVENLDKSILLVGESSSDDFTNLINKGLSDVVIIKIR